MDVPIQFWKVVFNQSFFFLSPFFLSLTDYQLQNKLWWLSWLAGWLKTRSLHTVRGPSGPFCTTPPWAAALSSSKECTPERASSGKLNCSGSWAASHATRIDLVASAMAQSGVTCIWIHPLAGCLEQTTQTFRPYTPSSVNEDKNSIYPRGCC